MKRENLPIWRCLQQMLVQVELSVKGFSRYNKYSIGTELRQSALTCNRLLIRALNTPAENRLQPVTALQAQCDSVKALRESVSWLRVQEQGHLKSGLKKRVVTELQINPEAALLAPLFKARVTA